MGRRTQCLKWICSLCKYYMPKDIHSASCSIEAKITLVRCCITKKDTRYGPWLKFVGVEMSEVWITKTTKDFEMEIIRWVFVKKRKWGVVIEQRRRHAIDKGNYCGESIGPKFGWKGSCVKKSELGVYNMTYLVFDLTILLRCIRATKSMEYTMKYCPHYLTPLEVICLNFRFIVAIIFNNSNKVATCLSNESFN